MEESCYLRPILERTLSLTIPNRLTFVTWLTMARQPDLQARLS
jgi:hypothetical protein